MLQIINNALDKHNIDYLDVKNISSIIYSYLHIDLTKDDFYADHFENELTGECFKVKNGWFVPCNNSNNNNNNKCFIATRDLNLVRKKEKIYVVEMNWWKHDMCFGFQSTFLNSNGKLVEFHIENCNTIQIGNKSCNGIVSFLSNKENFVYMKSTGQRTSKTYNYIQHANHLTYDTFYFIFDEPIDLHSGKMIYHGDTINIPSILRGKCTEEIILEHATYCVRSLEIINKTSQINKE